MTTMRFRSRVEQHGSTATGIPVPPETMAALGAGGRPAVLVTLGAHTYGITIGTRGGQKGWAEAAPAVRAEPRRCRGGRG